MPSSPPRVLHISTERGWRGGERQVQLLTDGMLNRGWPCWVACPPESALFADRRCRNIALPLQACSEFDPGAVAQIVRLAREHAITLLHAHTSHAHTLAWMAGAILRCPIVVTRRVDFQVGRNWFSRRKYLSPRVTHIAISRGVRDVLLRAGIPSERVHVVYSGIDLSRYPFRGDKRDEDEALRLGIAPDEKLLLNVAALVDHKDHATLIHAAAFLRTLRPEPWKLLIAGAGELESQIRTLIAQLGLEDRVRLLGYVQDLECLYRAADIFVLSSHLEGLCTSVLDDCWRASGCHGHGRSAGSCRA